MQLRIESVLSYCEPHIDEMWAASIVAELLGCDFRRSKEALEQYWKMSEGTKESFWSDNAKILW